MAAIGADRGRSLFVSGRGGEDAWKSGQYDNTGLGDGMSEFAMTHEEINVAFLTFQKDADQIFPGWNEKLAYTGESTVQAAISILWPRDRHSEHPGLHNDRGRSLFLSDGISEAATTQEEIKGALLTFQKEADQIYPGWKEKLPYTDDFPVQAASSDKAYIDDGCDMLCCFLPLAVGNNQGMGDVECDTNSDFYMTPAEANPEVMSGMHAATKVLAHGDKKLLSANITADDSYALFDRGRAGDLSEMISQVSDGEIMDSPVQENSEDRVGLCEFLNDQLADDSIYEDVNKFTKVGKEIRGKIMDNPFPEHSEDKVGLNEFLNDQLADDSIHEDVDNFMKIDKEIRGQNLDNLSQENFKDKVGLNESLNDQLADGPIYEDVDKLTKVGKEIRGKIMDNPSQEICEDKVGLNEFLNDQLAGDSIYEDLDKLTKVGKAIRGKIMDNPSHETSEDKVGINEFLNDQPADESIDEDVDQSTKVGKEIRGKIMNPPLISQLVDVGIPVPDGLSTTSHAYKDFLDKVSVNEFINDELADESIYEDVDRLTNVGKDIHGKIMDNPFQGLPDARFVGQQETYSNVMGYGYADTKLQVHLMLAILFTDRVTPYRHDRDFEYANVQLCTTCRKRVRSGTGSAGAMFSADTASGFEYVVFVSAAGGPGATVADGTVNPVEWYVVKPIIAQARPETMAPRQQVDVVEEYKMPEHGGETILEGRTGVGTPTNRANYRANAANNHPENIQPDIYATGSPLSAAIFVSEVGYLTDGTPPNNAENIVSHPENIQLEVPTMAEGNESIIPRTMASTLVAYFTKPSVGYYYLAVDECLPEVVQDMRAAIRETGNGTLLSTNITADDPNEMIARGEYCLPRFGPLLENYAFMVDGPVAGGTAPQQFLHYHRAGHAVVTSTQTQRGYTAIVPTKISQVVGASGIHTGTMRSGKMEGDASDKNMAFMLQDAVADGPYHRQEWEGMKLTTLIISGGMNPLRLPSFTDCVISYRHGRSFEHETVQLCATCQMTVRSETGFAGALSQWAPGATLRAWSP